jgi:hypothetical protein
LTGPFLGFGFAVSTDYDFSSFTKWLSVAKSCFLLWKRRKDCFLGWFWFVPRTTALGARGRRQSITFFLLLLLALFQLLVKIFGECLTLHVVVAAIPYTVIEFFWADPHVTRLST